MRLRRPIAVLALLAGTTAAVGAAAGPPGATGLYTAAQAAAGAEIYAERCAMCHGRALEGTHEVPGLTGKFVANWAGRPVGDLNAYVGRAMPQFAPGSLAPEETTRLVAFLLRSNGYPPDPVAGDTAGAEVRARMVLAPPPPPR